MRWQRRTEWRWWDTFLWRYPQWHLWFAWHPVRVENKWVWWEHVERRCRNLTTPDYGPLPTEYRLPVEETPQ